MKLVLQIVLKEVILRKDRMRRLATVFLFATIPLFCAFAATSSKTVKYYYNKDISCTIRFFQPSSTDFSSDSSNIVSSDSSVSYGDFDGTETYKYVADMVCFSNYAYTCDIKLRYTGFDNKNDVINMKLKCLYYDSEGESHEVEGSYSSYNKNTGSVLLPYIQIAPYCPVWTTENVGTKIAKLYALADPTAVGTGNYSATVIMEISEI